MSQRTGYALLEEGWVAARAEHLAVVVGLQHDVLGGGDVALDDRGGVAYVGSESEAEVLAAGDVIAYVLRAIVRHGEGLDGEARQLQRLVDGELAARGPQRLLYEAAAGDAVVHQGCSVDGEVVDCSQHAYGAYVVGVVVRHQHATYMAVLEADALGG